MVQVMIRLQNRGVRNKPYWWIIVQPKNKCFQGKALEKIGVWAPRKTKTVDRHISVNSYRLRYWLSVGAVPTDGAQRILSKAGLYVKKPVPFGSKFLYPKKGKTYALDFFHKHRWGLQDQQISDLHHYEKIKTMETILKTKIDNELEVLGEIVRPKDLNSKYMLTKVDQYGTDMNTEDINSDDMDFYSRKRNFDIISKKLNTYYDTKFSLFRGNDLRYNNYLRKLDKLSKFQSLDYEGFKDYIGGLKELNESKNESLQKLSHHFLNELLNKESMKNDLKQIVKASNENENEKPNLDVLIKLAKKDVTSIIDSIHKGFTNAARSIFKVSPEEHFTDKSFQDLKNLRLAKLLIKLRQSVYSQEGIMKEYAKIIRGEAKIDEISAKANEFLEKEIVNDPNNNIYMYEELLSKVVFSKNDLELYDDYVFDNINNYLLSTETIQKYKHFLFDPEFYGHQNLSKENKAKLLDHPTIYLLNNEILDDLIDSLLEKIKKSYEMNEIYRDEETDLKAFDKEEEDRIKRREEMDKKLKALREKHGDFDFMYDDYKSTSKELKEDLREFKIEYQLELESELENKFKRVLKMIRPPVKLRKYFTQEEVDEVNAHETKLEKIKERVYLEVKNKKLGIETPQPQEKEELTEELKNYESTLRNEFEVKLLGLPGDPYAKYYSLLDNEQDIVVDFQRYADIETRKYEKQGKMPRQDDILSLNKRKLRLNDIYINSWQQSKGITKDRQLLMKKRFLEYFGVYRHTIYPEGFRHYETFESYQSLYPHKTLADYRHELYEICTFDTYVEVIYGALENYKKIAMMSLEFPELYDRMEFLTIYLKSKNSSYIKILKSNYVELLTNLEEKNMKLTLIDAIEFVSIYGMTDSIIPELKKMLEDDIKAKERDVILTNQTTMRKLPHLELRGEDLKLNRVGPFMPINPLKAHRANPVYNLPREVKFPGRKFYPRNKKAFSTLIRPTDVKFNH